ncbi:MAG: hypothetical protein M3Y58_13565 [Chloroflexota bacterium]|nr:hypothetical protein [Chloroflexota bacterium]
MTKEQMIALKREAEELTRALADASKVAPPVRNAETTFKRRVDAVWGNIATEEPDVRREDVERQLRDSLAAR